MTGLHLTVALIGFGLAATILYLLRRDHLYLRDGLFWIGVALMSLLLGVWPRLIDGLGKVAGVLYPPALFLMLAVVILTLKALLTDIECTRLRRDVRRLNQRMALYEDALKAGAQLENGGGEQTRKESC
jgi:hypothetical protein